MGKVKVRLNQEKLTEQISKIEKLAANCDASAKRIQDESVNQGDVYPSASHFKSDIQGSINNVNMDASDIRTIMNRIIEINQNGLGTKNPGGTITFDIPESVNRQGVRAFDDWTQGVADAQKLIKYSEGDPEPSEAELKEFYARMQQNQDNPNYASAFIDPETGQIGPSRLLDIPTDLQGMFSASWDKGKQRSTTLSVDVGTPIVGILAHILSAASTTWSNEVGTNYANELVNQAQDGNHPQRPFVLNGMLQTSRTVDIDGDGGKEEVGLDYNDAMVTTLARRLEDFKAGKESWGHSLNPFDGGLGDTFAREQYGENLLAGVVHAMTGNVGTAQEWLVSRNKSGKGEVTDVSQDQSKTIDSRIRNLIAKGVLGQGQWTTDWARLGDEIDQRLNFGDTGNQAEDRYRQSVTAATTASIMNGLGDGENPPTMSDEARLMVSRVFARHPESVVASTEEGNPLNPMYTSADGPDGSNPRFSPRFTDRALSNLLGQVSINETARTHFGSKMAEYYQKRINEGVKNYKETGDVAELQTAVDEQSRTNGFVTGAVARQASIQAKNGDKGGQVANDAASAAVGMIPIPILNSASSFAITELKPFVTDHQGGAAKDAQNALSASGSYTTMQVTASLLNSGLYSSEDLKASWNKADNNPAIGALLNSDGSLKRGGITREAVDEAITASEGDKDQGGHNEPASLPDEVDIPTGLEALSAKLHNERDAAHKNEPELSFHTTVKDSHKKGFNAAKPEGDAAPSNEWSTEGDNNDKKNEKDG